ncbi:MAG: hypothetical protein DA330_08820 [Nitrososphaera sp.]|nr:hypothetical protein [Nitrososphaera sp.]
MKDTCIFENVVFYDCIPPFEENKIVFVLPSPMAFQNYYLVVDNKQAVGIIDYVVNDGYKKIRDIDVISYLRLINVRKGFPFGVTGNIPIIHFKLN